MTQKCLNQYDTGDWRGLISDYERDVIMRNPHIKMISGCRATKMRQKSGKRQAY